MGKGGAADFADLGAQPLGAADFADLQSQPMQDAPNSPPSVDTSNQDHPDNTMRYLGMLAKAIYSGVPGGAVAQNGIIPAIQGAMGKPPSPDATMTQQASNLAGSIAPSAAKSAVNFAAENGDVMAGAGMGAAASLPFAPAAGPFAPAVPVLGALTGAVATRAAVKPMQAGLQKLAGNDPGQPGYATGDQLTQAAVQGANQEMGGQILNAGIKMGADGLDAAKQYMVKKAKEILPDMGENLLSIPSESINRVFDRFKDLKPSLKQTFNGPRRIAQSQADDVAATAYEDLSSKLVEARRIAGKRLIKSENVFIARAKDAPIVDAGDLTSTINAWKSENPALAESADVKKIIEAVKRYTPTGDAVTGISAGQPLSARPAIALRRELDSLSSWNAGGTRAVENDAADRLAKSLSARVREGIRTTAEQISPKYSTRLTEFADLVDAHNNALGTLSTNAGTDKAIALKLDNLSNLFNSGGAKQAALVDIGSGVRGAGKIQQSVQELADALAVRSFQKVPKRIPSGVMLRLINAVAPTRSVVGAAGSALSGPSAATPYAMGAKGNASSRLASALMAQSFGPDNGSQRP